MPTRLPALKVPPIGFAHRGARAHAPENTLEAFELALRLGASGLESDVWLTADGEAVLDHDGVVGRKGLRRRRIAVALPCVAVASEDATRPQRCGSRLVLGFDAQAPVGMQSSYALFQERKQLRARAVPQGLVHRRPTPAGKLAGAPLFIDDSSGLSILQLRAKARRMHAQYGVRLFVIDYLQLLHSTARRSADNRQQEIADLFLRHARHRRRAQVVE